jgi:3-deoxy-D-manno-octulosonic-acid transferase
LGGSIAPIGGHNVIEPAHFACAILHGPNGQNFQETTDMFVNSKAMITVNSAEEMADKYKLLIENPDIHERMTQAAKGIALSHDTILERLCADLSGEIRSQHGC